MKGIFITGTGTDIGKSAASMTLCIWGISRGLRTAYYKPIQCGKYTIQNGAEGGDCEWIKYLCPFDLDTFYTCLYADPVSPHLAAEREKTPVDTNDILKDYHAICSRYDFIVVEGAGGAAVPVNRDGLTVLDFANRMNIPSILVCSPGLGTLHHTVTSHLYMKQRGASVSGFIMCHNSPEIPEVFEDNIVTIKEITGMPYIGEIAYSRDIAVSRSLSRESGRALAENISSWLDYWWEHNVE